MSSVSLEQISKRFRGTTAVRELSLHIDDGEFVSVVGPSGCGKSTTLHLIAGLEVPTQGEIRIDGKRVNELSPAERDVALVFQSYALYPHLDVRGNLAFPLKVAGLHKAAREERIAHTASLLGLESLLSRKPRELSGGQRQRVALGRALVRRPKLFLFDEPLSNLDAGLRSQMRTELKKLHEQLRATFIYVTHDQAEAMSLSDRVAVMQAGALQQVAPPRELYRHPANRFVAEFFGTPRINVVPPRVLGLDRGGPQAQLGIRPEHLEVGLGIAPAGALGATVFLVEPLGAHTVVTVETSGTRLTALAPSGFEASSGQPAWIRFDPAQLLEFAGERT